jgi:hypothetical protein
MTGHSPEPLHLGDALAPGPNFAKHAGGRAAVGLRHLSECGVACPLVLILGVFGRTPMFLLLRTLHSSF